MSLGIERRMERGADALARATVSSAPLVSFISSQRLNCVPGPLHLFITLGRPIRLQWMRCLHHKLRFQYLTAKSIDILEGITRTYWEFRTNGPYQTNNNFGH